MPERQNATQRLRLQNIAEREVARYAGEHALWHKHVHNVDLDPMQVLKCVEMDTHKNTIDFSCRRTGKTAIKELYLLHWNATNNDQELGIVAPREAQALVNLGYHLEAIRRSEILTNYLKYQQGRRQIADSYYQFANNSISRAYGIMAQVDGGDLTTASLEEVDDMPKDRLFSRFLLMMGSSRRLGAAKQARNDPQIRITGVFKGADTLTELLDGEHYYTLPTIDCYLGIELGILNADFIDQMRVQLAPDEYIRQLLCQNVSAKNLIWESYIRKALQVGASVPDIQLAEPVPGKVFKKRGLISFGYDAGGHGERPESSKHALVVTEQIGNFVCVIYCRTWAPGADDAEVKRDLISLWRYFRPDTAHGDAFGVAMLSALNDDLYTARLTHIDRRTIGDGSSTASTWPEWPFSPLRYEGMTKHQMARALRAIFHHCRACLPYIDDLDDNDLATADYRLLIKQLPNIKPVKTTKSYESYKMASAKLGDDLFDAMLASVWGFAIRGVEHQATVLLGAAQSRDQLMHSNGELLNESVSTAA